MDEHTGRATESEVASSALMSTRIQRLPKAARNLHPGLNDSADDRDSLDVELTLSSDCCSGFAVSSTPTLVGADVFSAGVDILQRRIVQSLIRSANSIVVVLFR